MGKKGALAAEEHCEEEDWYEDDDPSAPPSGRSKGTKRAKAEEDWEGEDWYEDVQKANKAPKLKHSEEEVWESWAPLPMHPGATSFHISVGDRADIKQWLGCIPVGWNVPGTPLVPVKTPFEGALADRAYAAGMVTDEQWFGKAELLGLCKEQQTPIGLVIDMVNTDKYYTGFSQTEGIEYHKVRIAGRTVPERRVMEDIFARIDEFVVRRPKKFVAVHCTHGVNRTGFLVAAYLMMRGIVSTRKKAVSRFEKARGMKMDKEYLLEALDMLEAGQY